MPTSQSPVLPVLRVLVVEDGVINRHLAIRLLESQGHMVTAVINGAQALVALRRDTFDVIFMDVDMPEMDGLSATREIRSGEPGSAARIPIVALTSNDNRDECLQAGMDAFLPKPLRPDTLTQVLDEILPNRAA